MRWLLLIAVLAPASLSWAQTPPPPPSAGQQALFAEIEALIGKIRGTRPSARSRLLDRLHERCGAFLDEHLATASPEQLSLAGTTWIQLAAREGDTPVLRKRLKALREHEELPSDLRRLVRLHSARLAVKVGGKAPAFQLSDPRSGETLELKAFRGSLLLIDFWSRKNPNSQAFVERKLVPLHARFKQRKGLAMLSVATVPAAESKAEVARATERGMAWRLGFEEKGRCAVDYGASDLPYLVLVDGEGKILALGPGWRTIDQVTRLLAERLEPRDEGD